MESIAKLLLFAAGALALVGLALLLASKVGISRLPGDVTIRKGNFTFYAPIGLMILLSVVATLVLNLILRR
jgi:cytosine/uracil/thiamine/allantoin permease